MLSNDRPWYSTCGGPHGPALVAAVAAGGAASRLAATMTKAIARAVRRRCIPPLDSIGPLRYVKPSFRLITPRGWSVGDAGPAAVRQDRHHLHRNAAHRTAYRCTGVGGARRCP